MIAVIVGDRGDVLVEGAVRGVLAAAFKTGCAALAASLPPGAQRLLRLEELAEEIDVIDAD